MNETDHMVDRVPAGRSYTGGETNLHRLRLRLAAVIRYIARKRGIPIREAFRRAMARYKHHRVVPWTTVEAFEHFCAGRRHRPRIEEIMARMSEDASYERHFDWSDGIDTTRSAGRREREMSRDEGEGYFTRALLSYAAEVIERPDRAEIIARRYASSFWVEVVPDESRYRHKDLR